MHDPLLVDKKPYTLSYIVLTEGAMPGTGICLNVNNERMEFTRTSVFRHIFSRRFSLLHFLYSSTGCFKRVSSPPEHAILLHHMPTVIVPIRFC